MFNTTLEYDYDRDTLSLELCILAFFIGIVGCISVCSFKARRVLEEGDGESFVVVAMRH